MGSLFPTVIDMGRSATVVILVVLAVRLVLKRAPRIISYALWAVVLLRLLCPFALYAPFGMTASPTSFVGSYALADESVSLPDAAAAAAQMVDDVVHGEFGLHSVRAARDDVPGTTRPIATDWYNICVLFGQYIWLAGMLILIGREAVSLLRLRKRLVGAAPLRGNIYLSDHVEAPFVMGLFRPKIYLPSGLTAEQQAQVIPHEQHHIRRGDQFTRLLAFAALCIHWFNPLVWAAFILSGRDMEVSCDEAVLRNADADGRNDYAQALLSFASVRRRAAGAPLSFSRSDTGLRVKNALRFRRPPRWLTVILVCLCAALSVCLVSTVRRQDDRSGFYPWTQNVTAADLTLEGWSAYVGRFYGIDRETGILDAAAAEKLAALFHSLDPDQVVKRQPQLYPPEYHLWAAVRIGDLVDGIVFQYSPAYPSRMNVLFPSPEFKALYKIDSEEFVWIESPELIVFLLDHVLANREGLGSRTHMTFAHCVDGASGSTVETDDESTIFGVLKLLAAAKERRGFLFQNTYLATSGTPQAADYYTIHISSEDVARTYDYYYYLYEANGGWRLDVPYTASYTLSSAEGAELLALLEG